MYCGYCGAYVADDLNFCENCGKPIKKATAPAAEPVFVAPPAAAPMQMPVQAAPVQKKKSPVWLFVLLGVVLLGCAVLGASLLFAGGGDYTYTFADPAKYFVENDVHGAAIYPAWREEFDGYLGAVYDTNFGEVSAANFAMEHYIVPFYEGQGFKLVKTESDGNQTFYFFRYGGWDAETLPSEYDSTKRSHLKFTVNDKDDGTVTLGVAWSDDLYMEPFDAPVQVKDESQALFSFYSPTHYDAEGYFTLKETYDEQGRHVAVYTAVRSDDARSFVQDYMLQLSSGAFQFDESAEKTEDHTAILLSYEDPSVTPMTYFDEASMYSQRECALALLVVDEGDTVTLTLTYCDDLAMKE